MKKIFFLLLYALISTISFAQFVGSSSVGSINQRSHRESSFQLFKPHSDSYNRGLLLSANVCYVPDENFFGWGIDIGYRFNRYLYAGIGAHGESESFPIELRAYIPLQNVSYFIGGFAGPSIEGGFSYPSFGGRVGVNRRFWSLSISVMDAYTVFYHGYNNSYGIYNYGYYLDYELLTAISLEYSLPLRAIKQRIF